MNDEIPQIMMKTPTLIFHHSLRYFITLWSNSYQYWNTHRGAYITGTSNTMLAIVLNLSHYWQIYKHFEKCLLDGISRFSPTVLSQWRNLFSPITPTPWKMLYQCGYVFSEDISSFPPVPLIQWHNFSNFKMWFLRLFHRSLKYLSYDNNFFFKFFIYDSSQILD